MLHTNKTPSSDPLQTFWPISANVLTFLLDIICVDNVDIWAGTDKKVLILDIAVKKKKQVTFSDLVIALTNRDSISKQKHQTGKVKTQHNVPTSTLVQVNNEIWVNSFEKPELHFFDVKNYSQLGSAPFQSDSPIFDLETVDNTVWGGTLTGSILIFDGTVSGSHCKFSSIFTFIFSACFLVKAIAKRDTSRS